MHDNQAGGLLPLKKSRGHGIISNTNAILPAWEKENIIMAEFSMDKIVALCNNRGFIFPGSDIYGGLANTWDYGPLGVEFKNNVKRPGGVSLFRKAPIM